jgi:two-component system NarL family sensor kinase
MASLTVRRVPIESAQPIAWFAALRVAMVAVALLALAIFDVPHRDRLILLTAALAAPLALGVLYLARTRPDTALNPVIAVADLAILALAEVIAPESYAAVRYLALFLIACHAHFQGEVRGVGVAAVGAALLVPVAVLTDAPVDGAVLAFYETFFVASALASGLFMGRLRTVESTGRLRARELSRRIIEAESKVRRRLAESIHDGPVQELVSLDLMLDAAHRSLERGDLPRAQSLIAEARAVAERNIGSLRDEIIALGPYALDELTLDVAIERCAPVWAKRFDVEVELDLRSVDLPNEICGALFGVAQEAVANAGRHAGASSVVVTVSGEPGAVELRVSDDGHGFNGAGPPMGPGEPGHIGLASMRERTEMAGGELIIDSSSRGTTVIARVPLAEPPQSDAS